MPAPWHHVESSHGKPIKSSCPRHLTGAAGPCSIPETTAHSAGVHTAAPTPNPASAHPKQHSTKPWPPHGMEALGCRRVWYNTKAITTDTSRKAKASKRPFRIILLPGPPVLPPLCILCLQTTACSRVWPLPWDFAPSKAHHSSRLQYSSVPANHISMKMVYSTATAVHQLS